MRELDPKLLERAGELNIVIKGTWGDARIQQAIDEVEISAGLNADDALEAEVHDNSVNKFQTLEWASERASKIFAGQSPHLEIAERIGRIRAALKDRGFVRWDDLVIDGAPADYHRYL